MKKLRESLSRLPLWLFTIIVTLAILWLTLAPHPLGDEMTPMFPGANKIAHVMMFGGLSIVMLLDWQRQHRWQWVGFKQVVGVAFLSACFGVLIEFLQDMMALGRGFEYADMIADASGAFFWAFIWWFFQKFWAVNP